MTFPILLQKLFDEGGGGNKLRQDIIPPVKSKTTSELNNFTGAAGEITFDTTAKRLVAHDGTTKGGIPVATKQEVEQVANSLDPRILDAASQADIIEAVSQATVGNVSGVTLEGLQAQISANASNIASVANKPTPVRYVTETWSSGASWYTKYSDGWVEQGGKSQCGANAELRTTFNVPFSNTDYSVVTTPRDKLETAYTCTVYVRFTTGFDAYYYRAGSAVPFDWFACGY